MSKTSGAPALTRKGAQEQNHILSLARVYVSGNPTVPPSAQASRERIQRKLRAFGESLLHLSDQMQEPGYTDGYDLSEELFTRDAEGLPAADAAAVVADYLDYLLDDQDRVRVLARQLEQWLTEAIAVAEREVVAR